MTGGGTNMSAGRAAAARAAGARARPRLWLLLLTAASAALGCAAVVRGPAPPAPGDIPLATNRGAKPVLTLNDANHPSVSADGRRVAVTPEIGVTEVYDVATGRRLRAFRLEGSFGHAISADGARLVIFADTPLPDEGRYTKSKREALFYEIDSGRELARASAELSLGGEFASSLSVYAGSGQGTENISSDLRLVAAPVYKRQQDPPPGTPGVVLGDLEKQSLVRGFGEFEEWDDDWSQVSLTPAARAVAATRHNIKNAGRNVTAVWDAQSGRELVRLPFKSVWLALSADGRRLVTSRDDSATGGSAVLSVDSQGRPRARAAGEAQGGDRPSGGQITEVWDVASGRRLAEVGAALGGKRPPLARGTLSPDGRLLATASGGHVLVWDAASGRLSATQPHGRGSDAARVKTVAFSADGQFLVTSGFDENVKVWRVADLQRDAAAAAGDPKTDFRQ
jgi:hypothetical protein